MLGASPEARAPGSRGMGNHLGCSRLARAEGPREDRPWGAGRRSHARWAGEAGGGRATEDAPRPVAEGRAGWRGGSGAPEVPHEALGGALVVGGARGGGAQ